ncbi:MAG TPA: aspartate--ammonia ligase [Prolixibacteraceae bacterium]|nr:aspartate--ammonia ligase [Prolixibacteraceae bacterium]
MKLYLPENYKSKLDLKQTEKAIKFVKDFFQENLSAELRLRRVTAPLFVLKGTGINDDLNGVERPVTFAVKEMNDAKAEVVHSLAKWKRLILAQYGIPVGYGIYTDMNAIRADEELTNIHSLYVDQWDWEKVLTAKQRNLEYLKKVVNQIYAVMLRTEFMVYENYPAIKPILPEEITFIHAEELAQRFPALTSKEREYEIAKEHGAVFIIGIGGALSNGEKHDGRAPDYDDWTTENSDGFKGLNGDIIIWNPVLQQSLEISSMGIRVDKEALLRQLAITGLTQRKDLLFHKKLLKNELPQSVGGGIGQSRLCMYLLRKAHIGEVQASLWPEEMIQQCAEHNIFMV